MTYDAIRQSLLARLTLDALSRELLDYSRLVAQADRLLLAALASGAPAADIYELAEGHRLMLHGHLTAITGAMQIHAAAQRSPALAEAMAAAEPTPSER